MVRSSNPAQQRAEVCEEDSSRCGQCGSPSGTFAYLVPQEGKKAKAAFPLLHPTGERSSPQTRRHCENPETVKETLRIPVFTRYFQNSKHSDSVTNMELGLLPDVDSSHFPLERHTSLQIYKHSNGDWLCRCGFHIHKTPTTMSWQGPHHAGACDVFTPQQFTLWL